MTDLGGGSYLLQETLNIHDVNIYTLSAVPEPAAISLLVIGGITLIRRKRK